MKNDFSRLLSDFFLKHLPTERGFSINTIKNYRDTFVQLIEYLSMNDINPDKIAMDDIGYETIINFLNWLENTKKVSTSTRNNRLAGIKSFFKYVSYHEPKHLHLCSLILEINQKKTASVPMNYLTVYALKGLLKVFNQDNKKELRDFCIILLLYESGARVSELIGIKTYEVRLSSPSTVVLHGKGSKTRIVPIDESVANTISKYIAAYNVRREEYLFFNSHREKLTREGINHILQKYYNKARSINPSIYPEKISPHCLRHSKGMHLLENGVNLIYIRDLLGHASVTTTEIYSKANPEIKRKYLLEASEKLIDEEDYTLEEKAVLLDWLKEKI